MKTIQRDFIWIHNKFFHNKLSLARVCTVQENFNKKTVLKQEHQGPLLAQNIHRWWTQGATIFQEILTRKHSLQSVNKVPEGALATFQLSDTNHPFTA